MPSPRPDSPLKCDHGQRRSTIVESLLTDIFQGHLQAGKHLVTQELANRFGVSHTPIREALISLAGMGIIDLLPNRGAVVRHIAVKEVREVCQVRRALECEAVKRACGRIPEAPLLTLLAECERLEAAKPSSAQRIVPKAREVDNQLHDLIAVSSGNQFLMHELNRLKLLFRAFRDVAWDYHVLHSDLERVAIEGQQHGDIVRALLANNRIDAAKAMSRHIMSAAKYWSRPLPKPASPPLLPVKKKRIVRD